MTCIPEEAQDEIQSLLEALDLFLGRREDHNMQEVRLITRLGQLHLHGHIPYLITPTDAVAYLGTLDTSSLPSAVLMSPAMGETASRRSGLPVVKHKPGNKGWGHEAAPSSLLIEPQRVPGQL